MEKDERSNLAQRVVVREVVWGRRLFLGEEEKVENKGGKRAEHSPWRKAGRVADNGVAVLKGIEADNVADTSALKGIAAGIAADTSALKGIEAGIVAVADTSALVGISVLMAKESSPPSPLQWTEASSEPA